MNPKTTTVATVKSSEVSKCESVDSRGVTTLVSETDID